MPRSKKRPPKPAFAGRGLKRRRKPASGSDRILLYGLHPVEAALLNPRRTVIRVLATENAARRLEAPLLARRISPELVLPRQLDRLVGPDAVHQGVVLEVAQLPPLPLEEVKPEGFLVVLDQVTDPHNVGAVLRSAAAFGASGLLMPERHSPPLTGVLAKSASGALDAVPVILVGNLAQALSALGERGFFRVGLAEEASDTLEAAELTLPLALVLGAEGKGLRQLTKETCDRLCRISTRGPLASLNVSNAAAIALHWAATTARAR
jgi:23S rRNA (guanosine2251-2'-O)-methyltransferase